MLLESVAILDENNVGLVSITENLDWSTPEGRLIARTLGNFSEFFSDMLSKHTKKGIFFNPGLALIIGHEPYSP